jgi:N-acetylneuraminic acid mutarotase
MKIKLLFIFFIFLAGANLNSFSQGSWTQRTSLPDTGRVSMAAFAIGHKGYFVTGGFAGGYFNELWVYDSDIDIWTRKADFPGARRILASGFSINGMGYVCGGSSNGASVGYNDFWEYNPLLDQWLQKANFPGAQRDWSISFSIGNYGYFGTGRSLTTSAVYKDLWRYDPVMNTWTGMPNVPGVGRASAIVFCIDDKAYIGYGYGTGSTSLSDLHVFDPVSTTWSTVLTTGFYARATASFALEQKGYVCAGIVGNPVYIAMNYGNMTRILIVGVKEILYLQLADLMLMGLL